MTPIATALASVSLLFAAEPAMAQMHGAGGGHAGGGIAGAIQAVGGAGRGAAHDGRAGHFGLRGEGFRIRGQAHDGRRFWPYGGWPYGGYALGYDYPWYAETYETGDDAPTAYAPPPAPPVYASYRRHDPNACAELSWNAAHRRYICTRRAG